MNWWAAGAMLFGTLAVASPTLYQIEPEWRTAFMVVESLYIVIAAFCAGMTF